MALIDDGIHRPGFEVEAGRLWTPGSVIPDDVKTDTTDQLAAMVSSPYAKYVFVTPQAGYNAQDYIDWRDDNAFVGDATLNAVGAYVFWLGDSSSCGGTIIQHNPADPMQAFLRDDDTKEAFSLAKIGRGGFFLLGDRQGAGVTATEIKKIMIDCNLDFIVLGLHRTGTGTQPEFSVVAFRHLVASLRWDIGPAKPIILMVSDENSNVHLMAESNRGNLFVGDISDQDTEAKQVALLDRAGYLSLNWWPLMAFVPNADDGLSVETTVLGMQNKLFHPMLVPASGSGCPFNTTRALTASEMTAARTVFVTPTYPGPVSNPKVRTTSAWFWDFEKVKNTSKVRTWSVLRGNLDATFDNIDYMSDMQVVFDSIPRWVGHPIYNMPFAVEFRMEARSVQNQVLWDADVNGPGNVPALHGVKDQEDEDEEFAGTLLSNSGWLTIVTPFELSPTANLFYRRDVTQDVRGVPVIPPWVEFAWLHEVSQEAIDDGGGWRAPSILSGISDFITDLLDLIGDALVWLPNQIYDPSTNDAGFQKWSAGLNQPHVVLKGTPGVSTKVGVDEDGIGVTETEGVETLKLENAPFAVYVQTVNFKMGPVTDEETGAQLGFVWPGRMFYVIPIVISDVILQMFDPVSTPAGLTAWNDLGFDLEGSGGTPVTFEADESLTDEFLALHIPNRDILLPLVDHKADFPPMLDSEDGLLDRDFSNHLARIDITHPTVLRAKESAFGGRTGRGRGFATKGVLTSWPISDDREIRITQDFFGTYKTYTCGPHRALDLQYTDNSHSTSTPILAAGPGVVHLKHCEECGPYIEIVHQIPPLPSADTFVTLYMHLDRRTVLEGANVVAGETIGFMGDRGSPGALHLHFAINIDGTCHTAQNPCDELPTPANGTNVECVGATEEQLICELFGAAIEAAGDDPLITDDHGNVVRKVDAALAIARFESTGGACGMNPLAQNCITIPGLGLFSHVGLFQIQNPTHIANDVGAGNISQASVVTDDPNCPGIEIAQDYKIAYNNILAAIRISSAGSNFGPWATWTETNPNTGELYYRECLGGGCP